MRFGLQGGFTFNGITASLKVFRSNNPATAKPKSCISSGNPTVLGSLVESIG